MSGWHTIVVLWCNDTFVGFSRESTEPDCLYAVVAHKPAKQIQPYMRYAS